MPANLTPEYRKAEEAFRAAKTREEKIAALEHMMAVIPKHKGTDHLQGDRPVGAVGQVHHAHPALAQARPDRVRAEAAWVLGIEREGRHGGTILGRGGSRAASGSRWRGQAITGVAAFT